MSGNSWLKKASRSRIPAREPATEGLRKRAANRGQKDVRWSVRNVLATKAEERRNPLAGFPFSFAGCQYRPRPVEPAPDGTRHLKLENVWRGKELRDSSIGARNGWDAGKRPVWTLFSDPGFQFPQTFLPLVFRIRFHRLHLAFAWQHREQVGRGQLETSLAWAASCRSEISSSCQTAMQRTWKAAPPRRGARRSFPSVAKTVHAMLPCRPMPGFFAD